MNNERRNNKLFWIIGVVSARAMRLLFALIALSVACVLVALAPKPVLGAEPAFTIETNAQELSSPKTILFFGNSLSAGFGLDPAEAFPALIQQKIDSLKWNYTVINAGLSGETSAGGLRRIDWLLQRKIDILVLELGANDGLRGIALAETRRNLQGIIDRTKEKHPHVQIVIAGMQVPPNLGKTYTQSFRALFPELARKNEAELIPFLLEGVGGVPELNLADGIHPNIAGHRKVAENVWKVLRPLLVQKK